MDIYYFPVYYKTEDLKNFKELLKILPKEIGIVYTIQFKELAKKIKQKLEENSIKVYIKKSNWLEEGQILGCNVENANLPVNTILYIGEGKFHPLEIIRKLKKKVIKYNPITGDIEEIKEDERFNKKINILRYKLLESKKIGIVTSIKPGQYYPKTLLKIKEKLEKMGKEVYLFITDNINFEEFLNFDIDFWIIVACPRLIDDIIERNVNALTYDIIKDVIDSANFHKNIEEPRPKMK